MANYVVIYENYLNDRVIFGWYDTYDVASDIARELKKHHGDSLRRVEVYECKR